ncbi:ArsR/SmtB family transcription factor [Lignipirellula cremea]|uniref:HTH-type transcriptional regulator NmtR n=1 Tax=Lignipirellula cremea TaxID=2528010 RepID=A0A518DX14_9BACT|nr:metalloregulator ArsR/SmtB family transcription factor [Lignipirellula cremea]QDU96377.1 HTH-type transcriptional regulator NmtR [Lignipirellula cremea]
MDLLPISSPSCASLLKVLADETRLAVLQQLLEGPLHVAEINEKLEIEQSLLSHHLKVLRDAGLVVAQRDGKAVLYRMAPDAKVTRSGKAINLGCCQLSFE